MDKTTVNMDGLRWLDTVYYCVVRIQVPSTALIKRARKHDVFGLVICPETGV